MSRIPRRRLPWLLVLLPVVLVAGGLVVVKVSSRDGGVVPTTVVTSSTEDGASISATYPVDAAPTESRARKVALSDAPASPDWAEVVSAYEFDASDAIGPAEISVPIPAGVELAALGHYGDTGWETVPFVQDGNMAIAQVDDFSFFGWLVIPSLQNLEEWIQAHPFANLVLGGGTRTASSPCQDPVADAEILIAPDPDSVTVCVDDAGADGYRIVLRNDRRFYLDMSSSDGSLEGGLPWSCCGGRTVAPESTVSLTTSAGRVSVSVDLTPQAFTVTMATLIATPLFMWAGIPSDSGRLVKAIEVIVRVINEFKTGYSLGASVFGDTPDFGKAAREALKMLRDSEFLDTLTKALIDEGAFNAAGIVATSATLLKDVLLLPTVASEVRGALDLIAAQDETGSPRTRIAVLLPLPSSETSSAETTSITPVPVAPVVSALSVSLTENPFTCDGGSRVFGTVSGALGGESISFTSSPSESISNVTANSSGVASMRWWCNPDEATTWSITARGVSSGRTVTFSLTGRAPVVSVNPVVSVSPSSGTSANPRTSFTMSATGLTPGGQYRLEVWDGGGVQRWTAPHTANGSGNSSNHTWYWESPEILGTYRVRFTDLATGEWDDATFTIRQG